MSLKKKRPKNHTNQTKTGTGWAAPKLEPLVGMAAPGDVGDGWYLLDANPPKDL